MADVLLATKNAGKLREIRALVASSSLTWHGLDDFPQVDEPEETGRTFADNARLKALYYAERTGLPTLADDSGLEVDALDGLPGVDSAYYAGHPRSDAANNRKLVAALVGVPRERRTARFHSHLAFVHGGRVVLESDGAVEGLVIDDARGDGGFGYDPHFFVIELGRTMAELPSAEKNAVSHRGRALRAILPRIEAFFAALGT